MVRSHKNHINYEKYIRFYQNRIIFCIFLENKTKDQKNCKAMEIATQIIKKSISNNIFYSIIYLTNSKNIREKLGAIYAQVNYGIVYSILKKFLNHF